MDAPFDPSVQHDTVSSLVRHLEETIPDDEDISVGRFLPLLGVHGFVFFILVLALLNVAIFMLPGLSILFGIPMVIMAVQLLLGLKAPIFPDFVRRQKIKSAVLRRGFDAAIVALEKVEKAVKPRFDVLTHPYLFKMHAIVLLMLAFMVAVPIPFINIPPTLGVILLCIGLMQRDGIFVCASYVFALWSLWLYESIGRAAQGLL